MFEFMSNNPWLTFFLVLLITEALVRIAQAFAHYTPPDSDPE